MVLDNYSKKWWEVECQCIIKAFWGIFLPWEKEIFNIFKFCKKEYIVEMYDKNIRALAKE